MRMGMYFKAGMQKMEAKRSLVIHDNFEKGYHILAKEWSRLLQ